MVLRIKKKLNQLFFFVVAVSMAACAVDPNKMRLSDLGSRYWKGTYYLSVKGTTTSIKCQINPQYNSVDDVKVFYKGQDAEPLFDLDEDIDKINQLKRECFQRSFGNSL